MSTNVTYTTLLEDLHRYLERGDELVDVQVFQQLPRLINATERKIVQSLKLLGMKESLSDPQGFTQGVSVITKPDRWRQTASMFYGAGGDSNTRTPLFPRAYEYCRSYWPDDAVQAPPKFYADYDLQHWLIVPTPDAIYPVEILCYMQPPLLDESNQTNFFTIYTPNLLLYGALLEATPFLKNDERIPTWQGFWNFDLQTLDGQDLQRTLDNSAKRDKP